MDKNPQVMQSLEELDWGVLDIYSECDRQLRQFIGLATWHILFALGRMEHSGGRGHLLSHKGLYPLLGLHNKLSQCVVASVTSNNIC